MRLRLGLSLEYCGIDSGGGRGNLGHCQWQLPGGEDCEGRTIRTIGMSRESRLDHSSSEERGDVEAVHAEVG